MTTVKFIHLCAYAALGIIGGSSACAANAVITKEQAVEIARQEVVKLGWTSFEFTGAVFSKNWYVTFSNVPAVPGGHVTIEISVEGKIIHVHPGA
jgi:hypothetical protein